VPALGPARPTQPNITNRSNPHYDETLPAQPARTRVRAGLRQFTVEELNEAFAATRGLTMPSQLRRMMRAQGRDLHAEFLKLLPEPPTPIAIQRFSPRRLGLTLAVLMGAVAVVVMVVNNLQGLGLVPG
jgi:hypothetical protein